MADSRRTRDYEPELTFPGPDRMGVDLGGPANEGLSLPSNAPLSNDAQYIEEGSGVRVDPRSLAAGTVPAYVNPDDDAISGTQFFSGMGQLGSAVGNDLASLGRLGMRGLDAITPSRDTLAGIGQYFQDAHAIGTGQTPLYMMQQAHMQNMQQSQQMMAYRRQQMADQLQQLQESKRQHDMQLLEKAMSNPRASALLEQLGQDPNYSMAPQAAMLHKGMKDADYGSFKAYKDFIPEDIQARFASGDLSQHELNGWIDMAREDAKVNAKANAKSMVLSRAMNKDAGARTPFEAQLVEEHQNELEMKRLKGEEVKSKTAENTAQVRERNSHADFMDWQREHGGAGVQDMGNDREAAALRLYGKRYVMLKPDQMQKVDNAAAQFMGQTQGAKSTAVQQAQLAVPDKASDAEREKTVGDLSTMDLIDKLGKNYSADWVGPVRGRAGALMESYSGMPGVPEIGQDEAQFRADVTTFNNKLIKEITGAQMSEPEAARILSQAPGLNNPDPVFRARMKATRENLKMIAKRRREVLGKTGVDTSTLPALPGGTKQSGAQQPDKIQSVLDEVFGGK